MMHLPIVAFPLFLQTNYIRNITVVLKVSCFSLIFISSGKRHPLWSSFQENDPNTFRALLRLIFVTVFNFTGTRLSTVGSRAFLSLDPLHGMTSPSSRTETLSRLLQIKPVDISFAQNNRPARFSVPGFCLPLPKVCV